MKMFQTFAAVCAVAIPSLVLAAQPSQSMHVHVPFSFIVAGQEFAPGDYTVQASDNGVAMVQGAGHAAVALTVPTGGFNRGIAPALRFVKSQNRQYLVGIDGETTRDIPLRAVAQTTSALAR
jgi:hypothetical protein